MTKLVDVTGKELQEGHIIVDAVPSRGIIFKEGGRLKVSSDYNGKDILDFSKGDTLDQRFINENLMRIVGTHTPPEGDE